MAKVLMKGNEAIGEAAIRAGCIHFFGYPITPQSEVPEYLSRRLPEVGGLYLQAESEVAAKRLGAAHYITKPFTPDKIADAVRDLLRPEDLQGWL